MRRFSACNALVTVTSAETVGGFQMKLPKPIAFAVAVLIAPAVTSLALEAKIQVDHVMHGVETWGLALYLLSCVTIAGVGFGAIGSFIFSTLAIALLRPMLRKQSCRPAACVATGILAGVTYTAAAWAIHATPSSTWTLHNIVSGVIGTWPLVENLDGDMIDKAASSAAPVFGGIVAALAFSWLTRSQAAAT